MQHYISHDIFHISEMIFAPFFVSSSVFGKELTVYLIVFSFYIFFFNLSTQGVVQAVGGVYQVKKMLVACTDALIIIILNMRTCIISIITF